MTGRLDHGGSTAGRRPIRLFWYRRAQNFGDAISRVVTEYASGCPVEWAPRAEAELFGLGSLMEMIGAADRPDGRRPWVWGTGCMTRSVPPLAGRVRFAAVRGPITAEILGCDCEVFGDPGLLVADVLDDWPEQDDRIGVVPHLSKAGDPAWAALAADDPRIRVIDVTDPDPMRVVRAIASCAHVISSSLHGLVTADAFGVPNTWLDPAGNHPAPQLKFRDYARSVGRRFFQPLGRRDIPAAISKGLPDEIAYGEGIMAAKAALLSSFPGELKDRAAVRGAA